MATNDLLGRIKLKSGLVANINTTTTKSLATLGEPHYTTDTKQLYIFDGTVNTPLLPALGTAGKLLRSDGTDLLYSTLTMPTTIASGSVFAANSANVLSAITWASAGDKVLTNKSGTISWETASGGGTPGGSDTQAQFNDGGAFAGISAFTVNKTTNRVSISSLLVASVGRDNVVVGGGGTDPALDTLLTTRSKFTCNADGQVGIIDNATTLGYRKARGVMLDVVASTTASFTELSLSGSAVFEQSTTDRNRIFLINKQPDATMGNGLGSSSSALHWVEYYDDPDPYVAPVYRSAYEMGNDYWQGAAPSTYYGERYWDTITSAYIYPAPRLSWYLYDSVHALNKLYIDNNRIESWGYSYQDSANYRHFLFKEDYRGNLIFIGRNAGNEVGEDYGASICIGDKAGYNKSTGGGNILIGSNAGGSQTNGSNDCVVGMGAGQALDGGNNTVFGNYAGSSTATGSSPSANAQILIGAGANYYYAQYQVLIDSVSRGTIIATRRHALIIGKAEYTSPRTQTLSLNANVSVMGLNSLCDRDYGNTIYCRYTGEQIFKPSI